MPANPKNFPGKTEVYRWRTGGSDAGEDAPPEAELAQPKWECQCNGCDHAHGPEARQVHPQQLRLPPQAT
jgi:hypothetical protein